MPDGEPGAVVRGVPRVKIGHGTTGPGAALWVEGPVEETGQGARATELAKEYKSLIVATLQQARRVAGRGHDPAARRPVDDRRPGRLQQLPERRAEAPLLETADIVERLETAIKWTREHLAELDVAETIRKDVTEGMEKQQKEFLLRQQLAAVRKELKELSGDGDGTEEDDYRARVEAADLPEKVREAAIKEVDKLERTSEQSPEVGWIRTWLDTMLDIPWNERTEDAYDIAGARRSWTRTTPGWTTSRTGSSSTWRCASGAATVASASSAAVAGAVLALVGPPGVGKTSLGESVARAMGRKFVRVALGGVRDEAEIRGHRRTYVGALPGRIVRAIREAGTMNPVVLLDEVDKIGSDYRGDPAAALLEVLDPAQNHTFRDHYLEVELDLSDVVFLATANVLDSIPGPLLDRMELVRLDGYTEDEKVVIARDHLLPGS